MGSFYPKVPQFCMNSLNQCWPFSYRWHNALYFGRKDSDKVLASPFISSGPMLNAISFYECTPIWKPFPLNIHVFIDIWCPSKYLALEPVLFWSLPTRLDMLSLPTLVQDQNLVLHPCDLL